MSSHLEPTSFPFTTTAHHHHNHPRRRAKTPSFSSILLDAVYRSIDDDSSNPIIPAMDNNANNYTNQNAKHRRNKMRSDSSTLLETVDLRRAIMIDSWIDNHHEKPQPQPPFDHDHDHYQKIRIVRQKSVPAGRSRPSDHSTTSTSTTTTTSNSNSSLSSKTRADSCFRLNHAPPLGKRSSESSSRIFTKTKSRAMKIYGELRRPKPPPPPQSHHHSHNQQPISPGGRIAAFLNSIFRNSGGSPARSSNTTPSNSTCSSASSFSRSCLSKTPSSRGTKSSGGGGGTGGGAKRSVRFYPLSVIVDEDSRPCGQKSLRREDDDVFRKPLISPSNNGVSSLNVNVNANANVNMNEQRQNQRKWRREKEIDALMTMIKRNCQDRGGGGGGGGGGVPRFSCGVGGGGGESDEEMNDAESCASSDLFELENLSSIGVGRYTEELPVYGTTSLQKLTAA